MSNRILAISNFGELVGGGEHSFIDLIGNLTPDLKPIAVIPRYGELTRLCIKQNIKFHVLELPQIRPRLFPKNINSLIALKRLVRKEKPSVIYANGSRPAFYGGLIGRLCSIPCVWHCRIADKDSFFDFILGSLCAHIIANSEATSKRFHQRYQSKVSVIYNGFDLNWLQSNDIEKPKLVKDNWKVILVVARLSKWKRHDLALKVFERVAVKNPDAHLICVGGPDTEDSNWSDYLRKWADKSKFSKRIHWVDKVDDIRPWYRAATVLFLPSDNEPFGRVLIEAMANGVPVVATRGGGVPELFTNECEGFLVGLENEKEMRDALLKVLNNQMLRNSFSHFAKKKAEHFKLAKHTKEVQSIFNRVAKAK